MLFWRLEREIGLQEALECFQRAVDLGKEELDHDVMGCRDFWVHGDIVRKLDLSHLCFSLNFYFLMFLSQFPSMFLLLIYSQSFLSLSADHPRHSRQRRSKISILLIQETV